MRVSTIIAICAGFTITAAQVLAAPPPAIYTSAQASAGAAVFAQNCASCHGANLQGNEGPGLIGAQFVSGVGTTVGSLAGFITQQMPLSSPGSLTHTQYEDVMAYILSKNGYPSGDKPLVYADSLNSTVPLVSTGK